MKALNGAGKPGLQGTILKALYLGDPSENFQNKELMKLAPKIALDGEVPRLIDEWQELPLFGIR